MMEKVIEKIDFAESYTLSLKALMAKLNSWATYLDFQKYSIQEDATLFESFSDLTSKIRTSEKALKLYLYCLFNKIQKNRITKEQVFQAFNEITEALDKIPATCTVKNSYSIPEYQQTIEKLLSNPEALHEAKESIKISRSDFIEDYFK